MSAAILRFPPRNKGRVRKSRSPDAMGRCSIGMLERDGEAIPKNVVDLRCLTPPPAVDEARLALRLALRHCQSGRSHALGVEGALQVLQLGLRARGPCVDRRRARFAHTFCTLTGCTSCP